MSSRCRRPAAARWRERAAIAALLVSGAGSAWGQPAVALRVCADPDNLPYSKADGSGFENRIARLVAADLHRPVEFAWEPLGRGFARKTIGAGVCDLVVGVPTQFERLLTTTPYYRSGYVFVDRADAPLPLASFTDPRLATLAIGVQLVGADLAATPAGYALARGGAVARVVGYPIHGETPSAERVSSDVASGRLDAALVWGPQAGYFATRSAVPLRLSAAEPPAGITLPFDFTISMGVRPGDAALRDAVDGVIARRSAEIEAILDAYGVPRLPLAPAGAAALGAADPKPPR